MASERPTFHEAWYRVAELRPKLHFSVQVYRQFYRGQMWFVLENPANNKFSRVNRHTYHFIALLDGRRTVREAWDICNEQLGDRAPTQGEVIRVLGQLYTSNLLYAELAPDTESLFNRYHTRMKRQLQAFFTNLLFIRIPLVNPNRFLDRWVHIFGKAFHWAMLPVWIAAIATGLYFIISNLDELVAQSRDVLSPDNLIYLYFSMVLVKVFHEFSHAFACKRFGRMNESGGPVHVMGVMFLVFMPLPFVDASSAWAFKHKRHRVIVGMAGILFELFVAAIAAVVWATTSTGAVHIIAYNIIFVASVSTLVFNGNPLLRFDAYYVMSDLIEIPNLRQRSWQYYYYLVKRYLWGLKDTMNPAHTAGEKAWFSFYGIASIVYRVFICVRILLFLNDRLPEQLFILVPIFAFSALFMWVVMPVGKFIRYLAVNHELNRNRERAVATTLLVLLLLGAGLGMLKMPDYVRVEGVVEPVELAVMHADASGFVSDYLPSGTLVRPDGAPVLEETNRQLETERDVLAAEKRAIETRWRVAEQKDVTSAQIMEEKLEAVDEKIAQVQTKLSLLSKPAPFAGVWIAPDIERMRGVYLKRGERIGIVAAPDDVHVRAIAGQELAAMIVDNAQREVEMRLKGRADVLIKGRIERIFPAGDKNLPSQALGYQAGGSIATDTTDPRGIKAAENFFEIRVHPLEGHDVRLLTGQRAVVRVKVKSKPLAFQWYHYFRQLFQRRFHI